MEKGSVIVHKKSQLFTFFFTILFSILFATLFSFFILPHPLHAQSPEEILKKVDQHRFYTNSFMTAKMLIKNRVLRTKTMKSWQRGEETGFVEFTNPLDAGTKMLKLKDQLWLYFPDAEDVVKISGHLLREGMMGSDFSYEDMMENQQLLDDYHVTRLKDEVLDKQAHFVLQLDAKHKKISYAQRRLWVEKKTYTISQMFLYSVSGEKLKEMRLDDYRDVGGYLIPFSMTMTDMLRKDTFTKFMIMGVSVNMTINPSRFTKAALYDDI